MNKFSKTRIDPVYLILVKTPNLPMLRINGELVVSVKDRGVGTSEADLPHVFDRFYQIETNQSATPIKGSGIGLSFTNQLATLLGGRMKVASQWGQGSTFTVWLPIHLEASQKDEDFILSDTILPIPLQAVPKTKASIPITGLASKQ